jgi:mannose-6-phosphate isomerase class I
MSQVLSTTEPAHRGSTRQESYPFKVLDDAQMLLIQAHRTKKRAEEGFARETELACV